MAQKGVPLVVSAPSGAGKTTLCRSVMQRLDRVEFSISYTTRPPRPKERDGVDYHFIDEPTFVAMAERGELLEWAHVYGKRYGTGRAATEERLSAGYDVLFDIDVQGGRQIAAALPDAVLLYILPPSYAELERRLRGRASDSEEQVQRRLALAVEEIRSASFYTHWIVNDDLASAVDRLWAILIAERTRRVDYAELMRRVIGEASGP